MNETKEMIVDFRRTRIESNNISIMGGGVEVVEECKNVVVNLDNRLDWRNNADAV